MGLPIALFVLFFLVLIALSFAAVRLFAGRASDGKRDPVGCLMGCAVGAGLLALGVLGFLTLLASLVVVTTSRAVQSFPVKGIYFGTEPGQAEGFPRPGAPAEGEDLPERAPRFVSDPARPLHVVFEIDGALGGLERMEEWIDEWSDGEARVQVAERTSADGRIVTWVDVALPADWRSLREIEEDVRKFFPEASWAGGLRIDFKSVSREW